MAEFSQAIPVILHHEGGWVCDPADPGGETNFGISMRFLREKGIKPEEIGIPNLEPGCLRRMTEDTARRLYARFFWHPGGYNLIDRQDVATKIFDCAVNMGPTQAHKLAQRALNVGCGCELQVDGRLGPLTLAALNKADGQWFLRAMCAQMADFYSDLAERRPEMQKFLSGWLARAAWTHQ